MQTTASNARGTKQQYESHVQKRRHVRLDLFSPVEYLTLEVQPDSSVNRIGGTNSAIVLNLSAGGVLLSASVRHAEGQLLLMTFDIQGFEILTDVLGKVKRVEAQEDGEVLIGVQFMTADDVGDQQLVQAINKLVRGDIGFTEQVRRLVSRFVFRRQVESDEQVDRKE